MEKVCKKCEILKSTDEFHWKVQRSGRSFPESYCKKCASRLAVECCTRLRRTNPRSKWVGFVDCAKRRGLIVSLTENRICEMFLSPCHYCGLVVTGVLNGIDRLDSKVGYVEGNVVSCCADCNFAKQRLSKSQFLDLVKRIAIHQGWLGE